MAETTLREMFVHNLEDIYYAENELLDALEELAEQTDDTESKLRSATTERRRKVKSSG